MTRYDPFTFGQVKLGGQAAAADGQPTAPDDLLFADGGSVKQAPAAADGDWSALTDESSSLLPTARRETTSAVDQFGTDILGETAPTSAPVQGAAPAAAAETQPVRPKAAATPRGADAASRSAIASPNAAKPARQSPLQTAAATAAAAAAAGGTANARSKPATNGSVPLRTARLPGRARSPMFALLVPVGVLAGGGAIASWLWLMQQNHVMAGIVGLSTVVGSALAHVAFRR
jgi:hypothetical protein